jgi:thiamine-phosphate diphosphorylase / hydroxyethylthiazole kinase
VLTGVSDYVSNGNLVLKLSNGNALLGNITGSGCMVGTAIASFCAATSISVVSNQENTPEDGRLVRGDMLTAVVGGYVYKVSPTW